MHTRPHLTLPAAKLSQCPSSRPMSLPPWSPDSPTAAYPPPAENDPYQALYGYIIQRPRRLKLVKFLGAGAFGCVFMAEDIDWVQPPSPPISSLVKSGPTNPPRPRNLPWLVETSTPTAGSDSSPSDSASHPAPTTPPDQSLHPDLEDLDFMTAAQTFFPLPRYYAIKCLDNRAISRKNRQREINNHLAVQGHRGVLELYGCVQQSGWTFVILEYAEDGDMVKSMMEKNVYSGCDTRIGEIFLQIADAVHHCHQNSVFHRDLKPENIMCRNGGLDVALGDFGLSTSDPISSEFGCGSGRYMSPECQAQGYLVHKKCPKDWKPQPYDTAKNDVWSLGVILFNMICGRSPWERACDSDPSFLCFLKRPLALREAFPISWAAFDLFLRIFDANPKTRITIPQMMEKVRKIKTFRMTPWEIEGSSACVQAVAEMWLSRAQRFNNPQPWTHYDKYPEHLDFPGPPAIRDPIYPYYPLWATLGRTRIFEVKSQMSVKSEDIVPSLEPSDEADERLPESTLVTPEGLVGIELDNLDLIPELDLAEGLFVWAEEETLSRRK